MGQVCSGDRKGGKDKMDSLAFQKKTIDERRSIVEYNGTNGDNSYDDMNRMPDGDTEKMTNSDEEFLTELNRQHMDQYRRRKSVTKLILKKAVNDAEETAAAILRRESIKGIGNNQDIKNNNNDRQSIVSNMSNDMYNMNIDDDDDNDIDLNIQRSEAFIGDISLRSFTLSEKIEYISLWQISQLYSFIFLTGIWHL